MNDGVDGAILLAGGQSRRMGTDKVALPVGAEPMGARVYRALIEVVPRVVVVSNRPEAFPVQGAWIVPDAFPGRGPLEGLASGLEASGFGRALTVACDMPFLPPALLRFLAGQRDVADAIVPCSPSGREPLLAVYSRRALASARSLLDRGERAISALLDEVPTRFIPYTELRDLDAEGRSFWNLNRPEDLAAAGTRIPGP